MFGNLGWTEILVISGLGLLLFGQRRLPDLAKGLGEGLRIFRKELFSDGFYGQNGDDP